MCHDMTGHDLGQVLSQQAIGVLVIASKMEYPNQDPIRLPCGQAAGSP